MNEKKSDSSNDVVQIKKYANRRLYNMETSSYVTLDDLQELVRKDVPFLVKDAKSEKDITRQILIQIILEQESGGTQMLPVDTLRAMIRYYETDMHQTFSEYLTNSMSMFTDNKEQYMQQFTQMGDWKKLQEQQSEWFKKTMEMMNPLAGGGS